MIADLVSATDIPGSLDKNELGADSLSLTAGTVFDRGPWHYTLEAELTSTRPFGGPAQEVFAVRPGVPWEVPGRFTSRDSIGAWGDEASLGNGYTFAGNNPQSATDPWGMAQKDRDYLYEEFQDGKIPTQDDFETGDRPTQSQFVPQFYSDYTIPFLEEGVRAGEVLALEGKVLLHQPSTLPNEIFGLRMAWPDQYRFALYARALLELKGAGALVETYLGVLDPLLAQMSAAQRAALDAEVAKLVADMRAAQRRYQTPPLSEDAGVAELCAG